MKRLITSESVSHGHPDKVADQISDSILDEYLKGDPQSKVAVETMVKDNVVVLGGEVKSNTNIDYEKVVKDTVKSIGYIDPDHGFFYKNLTVINLIGKQSQEINSAVEKEETTAGDQGFMIGYATNETPNMMPIGMYVSKKLVDYIKDIPQLGPDAKTQVTMETEGDKKRIHTILISTQHKPHLTLEVVGKLIESIIKKNDINLSSHVFNMIDNETNIYVNPAGKWSIGGPVSDCGLTGRKIVVDQYGPYCPVGGGAFSGKDFSKIDRSGAYLARYIAKNIVKLGSNKCKVEISYIIGKKDPTSLNIDTFGDLDDKRLSEILPTILDMTPDGIKKMFSMDSPVGWSYQDTSKGHYGEDRFPWENLDLFESIKVKYEKIEE
jgi:S-adenosylmethionine synthetase